MEISCYFCGDTDGGKLTPLSPDHEEYVMLHMTYDGTRKWFQCDTCKGVFCRDKIRGTWQISPKTYDDFVARGLIKDKLAPDVPNDKP